MQPSDRNWYIKPPEAEDSDLLYGLLEGARWVHRHLDWSQPADLLAAPGFLLALDDGLPAACLSAPPEPGNVAWLRLFAVASGYQLDAVWMDLWPRAAVAAAAAGARIAAALPLTDWMPDLLDRAGFEAEDTVVFLEWESNQPVSTPADLPDVVEMKQEDLAEVLTVDHASFDPLWRLHSTGLAQAFAQADYAACIWRDGEIAGYQICTVSDLGGHLARLAVHPAHQRQRIATALVQDAMRFYQQRRIYRLTVNTQGSNRRGLTLYERLGFRTTGQVLPVLACTLGPE